MTNRHSHSTDHARANDGTSHVGDITAPGRRSALWSMLRFSGLAMLSTVGLGQIRQAPPKPIGQPTSPQTPTLRQATGQTDWDVWTGTIMTATSAGIRTWMLRVQVSGVKIMAVSAIDGRFEGPRLAPMIQNHLTGSEVPSDVARAFADTISAGWATWEASLKFPGLPLFPGFAAFPGPVAPPTPGIAVPLVALVMDPTPFEPAAFRDRLRAAVGSRGNETGAATAIDRFAREFSARLGVFCASAQVQIRGGGPVPTFAPPYVPVGPVVAGDNVAAPGVFLSGTF